MRGYFVYILTNRARGVLYVGVTNDLHRRIGEHRAGEVKGFTKTNNLKKLVWYEIHDDINEAIAREKRLKRWRRNWKIELIENTNPDWKDLWFDFMP